MKYVCLGYLNPQAMDAKPRPELEQLLAQCGPHLETLYRGGKVIEDYGLANEKKEIRRNGGRPLVTDGPFIEAKELLGSVFIIEADNFEDAVRVASLHPTVQIEGADSLGWRLEVRPVHYSKNP